MIATAPQATTTTNESKRVPTLSELVLFVPTPLLRYCTQRRWRIASNV
jgi:hypothetical protein